MMRAYMPEPKSFWWWLYLWIFIIFNFDSLSHILNMPFMVEPRWSDGHSLISKTNKQQRSALSGDYDRQHTTTFHLLQGASSCCNPAKHVDCILELLNCIVKRLQINFRLLLHSLTSINFNFNCSCCWPANDALMAFTSEETEKNFNFSINHIPHN